jgi:hypothetical protein
MTEDGLSQVFNAASVVYRLSCSMAKTASSCWRRGLEGRAERGWFTTGCLLNAHPTRQLFLVEISEAPNASSLVPLTPMPGAFVWGLLRNGG